MAKTIGDHLLRFWVSVKVPIASPNKGPGIEITPYIPFADEMDTIVLSLKQAVELCDALAEAIEVASVQDDPVIDKPEVIRGVGTVKIVRDRPDLIIEDESNG